MAKPTTRAEPSASRRRRPTPTAVSPHPRRRPRSAGERSRQQYVGDRSPRRRRQSDHLRPLSDTHGSLDAVMEHATGQVVEAMRGAEPQRGEPVEALERVLRATWRNSRSSTASSRSTPPGSRPRTHQRHLPMLEQLEPLVERGQQEGIFRRDLPVSWHLAVVRAIVHTASREIQGGRITDAEAEAAMLGTAIAAISERPT